MTTARFTVLRPDEVPPRCRPITGCGAPRSSPAPCPSPATRSARQPAPTAPRWTGWAPWWPLSSGPHDRPRRRRAPRQPWTWPRARCGMTYDELAPHLSARARWLAATTRAARSHAARAPACVVLAACTVSARASAIALVVSLASVRDSFTTLGGISATAPQTTVAVAGARGLAIAGWDTRGHRAGGDGLCMPIAPVQVERNVGQAGSRWSSRSA
jgi:hypothetical protein